MANDNKTERRVEALEWNGKQARALIARRAYPTDIEDLWEAIVSPERLKRWFAPVSGDFEEGGKYQIEGNAHGTIEKCDPPRRLAITWEFQDGIGWVNVSLEAEKAQSTVLTLEHIAHDDEKVLEFWKQYGPGAMGVGWDISFEGLVAHVATGEDSPTLDEATWAGSAEGRDVIKASSDDWVAAAIEFGTPADEAREAGETTFKAYTGTE